MDCQYALDQARSQANDPNTDPEVLRALSQSPDFDIRRATILNPNTPGEVILELGIEFPSLLADNPVFYLLLLENPNLLTDLPLIKLRYLAKQENIPEIILAEYAIRESDTCELLELICNVSLSQDILYKLVNRRNKPEVSQAARLHVNWDEKIRSDSAIFEEIIRDNTLPKMSSSDIQALKWFVQLELIPDIFIRIWVDSKDPHKILVEIAKFQQTDLRNLVSLAKHSDAEVRSEIAANLTTPVCILETFANDVLVVRRSLAANPNTPIKILTELANNSILQPILCANPNFPEALRHQIWENVPQMKIHERLEFAKQPATPPHILDILAEDKSSFGSDPTPKIGWAVATNPNTGISTYEKMLKNPERYYRDMFLWGLRKNLNISLYDLMRLFKEKDFKAAVLENPNIPASLIEKLQLFRIVDFQLSFVKNLNATTNLLVKVLSCTPKHNEKIIRQVIAEHPNATWRMMEEFAKEIFSSIFTQKSQPT